MRARLTNEKLAMAFTVFVSFWCVAIAGVLVVALLVIEAWYA